MEAAPIGNTPTQIQFIAIFHTFHLLADLVL